MATVYLRVGVWVVVLVGVVCSVVRPRTDSSLQSLTPPPAKVLPQQTFREQTRVGKELATVLQALPLTSITSTSLPLPPRYVTREVSYTVSPQLTIADLQRRGSVTFVMQHSPASYFLQDGEEMGFEYELAEEFGRELGIRVDIITTPFGPDAISLLHEGKADILAGLATTDGMELDVVDTSQPYFETTAQIVTRSDHTTPDILDQLAG